MNTLTVAVFACVAVLATAAPSGLWGLGYGHGHGHLPVVGASGVVSSNGAAGPAGIVTGHGAIGPNGIPNAIGHGGWAGAHGLAIGHDDGQWHGEGLLASQDWAGHGAAVIAPGLVGAHGLGLGLGVGLGHGVGIGHGLGAVVAGPAGTIVSHGVNGHIGLGHHGW